MRDQSKVAIRGAWSLQFAAGVLPTYWPVKAVVAGILGESRWVAYLGVGTLVQLVWVIGIGRWFVARAD